MDPSILTACITGAGVAVSAGISMTVSLRAHPTRSRDEVSVPEATATPLPPAVASGPSIPVDVDDQSWYDIVGIPIMDWLDTRLHSGPFDLRHDPAKLAETIEKRDCGWYEKQRALRNRIEAPQQPVVLPDPVTITQPRAGYNNYCHGCGQGYHVCDCPLPVPHPPRHMSQVWVMPATLAEVMPDVPLPGHSDEVRILTKIELLLHAREAVALGSGDPKWLQYVIDEKRMLSWLKRHSDLVGDFYRTCRGNADSMRESFLAGIRMADEALDRQKSEIIKALSAPMPIVNNR